MNSPTPGINPWVTAVERVSKPVFRLEADPHCGSSVAISCAQSPKLPGYALMLATANHVVKDRNPQSILRLTSADGSIVLTSEENRIVVVPPSLPEYDIALVIVRSSRPVIQPTDLLPLLDQQFYPPRGAELGWLGFPIITWPELCFFRGSLSGYVHDPPGYLIDGVSIHGVSGGPAFNMDGDIFAVVQSCLPNSTKQPLTLPGLMGAVPVANLDQWMSQNLKASAIPPATKPLTSRLRKNLKRING